MKSDWNIATVEKLQQSTTEHYKKIGPYLSELFNIDGSLDRRVTAYIAEHYPSAGSILDFGCGEGAVSLPLVKRGYHVTFLDAVEKQLFRVQNELGSYNRYKIIMCNFDDYRAKQQYRLVIIKEALYHILSFAKLQKILSQIARSLTENGVIIIVQMFVSVNLYKTPANWTFVKCIHDNTIKVHLKRQYLEGRRIGLTFIKLEDNDNVIEVPPACFLNIDYQLFREVIEFVGLRLSKVIDVDTMTSTNSVQENRMYLFEVLHKNKP